MQREREESVFLPLFHYFNLLNLIYPYTVGFYKIWNHRPFFLAPTRLRLLIVAAASAIKSCVLLLLLLLLTSPVEGIKLRLRFWQKEKKADPPLGYTLCREGCKPLAVLKLDDAASLLDIERAYQQLAELTNPANGGTAEDLAIVQNAYEAAAAAKLAQQKYEEEAAAPTSWAESVVAGENRRTYMKILDNTAHASAAQDAATKRQHWFIASLAMQLRSSHREHARCFDLLSRVQPAIEQAKDNINTLKSVMNYLRNGCKGDIILHEVELDSSDFKARECNLSKVSKKAVLKRHARALDASSCCITNWRWAPINVT
eukprot:16206-Heterococcus_DN1.PRE.1